MDFSISFCLLSFHLNTEPIDARSSPTFPIVYKVVFFCLTIKNVLFTKPIEFSISFQFSNPPRKVRGKIY